MKFQYFFELQTSAKFNYPPMSGTNFFRKYEFVYAVY